MDFYNKNKTKLSKRFSLTYVAIAIIGVVSLDRLITIIFESNDMSQQGPLTFAILYLISMGLVVFFILNHMQKIINKNDLLYEKLKEEEKMRLEPYEFALDNSVDAIYWFTLDAKFLYVNQAACNMVGYTKEEFLNMHLEQMDHNFTRDSAIACMREITDTKNWFLETTQVTKDGKTINIEVSGHGVNIAGKDYVFTFGRNISQRIEFKNEISNKNIEIQKSLDEKEILLKEIHHRVKNNMEIISSLLSMQYRRVTDDNVKFILKQSRSRINTMALVHEFLYLGENLAYINLKDYIYRLVDDIKELYLSKNTNFVSTIDVDPLIFSTNRCVQIGMVLHELCVNSLKYAFEEDRHNKLYIQIKNIDDKIQVILKDNGNGIEDINSLYKSDSIGMQLIHSIIEDQLDGTLEFRNDNGLECRVNFPLKEEG